VSSASPTSQNEGVRQVASLQKEMAGKARMLTAVQAESGRLRASLQVRIPMFTWNIGPKHTPVFNLTLGDGGATECPQKDQGSFSL